MPDTEEHDHTDGRDARSRASRDREARGGRPRDPTRDAAILDATLELLSEGDYDQVTVRAIAQRAGAGLATLYRRWPTKEELVVDAVGSFPGPPPEPPPGGDARESLVGAALGLLDLLQGPTRRLVPNIIGQLPRNPVLAEELRTRVMAPRLAAVAAHLRAVPGVDPDRVADAAELVPASLFFRTLVLGRRLDEGDVRALVAHVVATARPHDAG